MNILNYALGFLGYAVIGYFWTGCAIAIYDGQRQSRTEQLTDEERKANRFSLSFVASCSGILFAAVHLFLQLIALYAL